MGLSCVQGGMGKIYFCVPCLPAVAAAVQLTRSGLPSTPNLHWLYTKKWCVVQLLRLLFRHFLGWGRGWRRVVSDWYLKKEPMELSECVTKFRGRYGWTHRDIVRLCHLKSANVGNDGLCCEV